MPAQDRSRKLFVRSVLAATTTLATLVGAQNLALMDSKPTDENFDNNTVLELTPIPTPNNIVNNKTVADSSGVSQNEPIVETAIPILSVEPSIIFFRQSGSPSSLENNGSGSTANQNNTTASLNNNTEVILPPSPVVLQAPEPVVIVEDPIVVIQQQPAQQQQAQQPVQQQAQQNSGSKKSKSGSSK